MDSHARGFWSKTQKNAKVLGQFFSKSFSEISFLQKTQLVLFWAQVGPRYFGIKTTIMISRYSIFGPSPLCKLLKSFSLGPLSGLGCRGWIPGKADIPTFSLFPSQSCIAQSLFFSKSLFYFLPFNFLFLPANFFYNFCSKIRFLIFPPISENHFFCSPRPPKSSKTSENHFFAKMLKNPINARNGLF